MEATNLKHLSIAFNTLSDELCENILEFWGVHPKLDERKSIICLVNQLDSLSKYDRKFVYEITDKCFFGFTIPRISKEFDCLWIGEKTIVDIELKSQPVDETKICRQLRQNKYYLRYLNKEIQLYTFVASNNLCYTLNDNDELISSSITEIGNVLFDVHQEKIISNNIERLFSPDKYLVSPFNSTQSFLQKEYFLTNQQQEIKDKIIQSVNNNDNHIFYAITGGAGSGKTLLLYDIAMTLMDEGKRVVIGHCGGLNDGHNILKQNGWNIYASNYIFTPSHDDLIDNADVYLIDEAQRSPHIDNIRNCILRSNKKCIFAFDPEQVLCKYEKKYDNKNKIISLLDNTPCFQLKTNIRMNQAVYEFVHAMFDLRCSTSHSNRNSVSLTYCTRPDEVESTLSLLGENGFVVPKFTPMLHSTADYEKWFPSGGKSAHQIIGQEFDNIVGVVSPNMFYNDEGRLISKVPYYYYEDRMLFQILSRARNKIHIVIYGNQSILNRCLSLIK